MSKPKNTHRPDMLRLDKDGNLYCVDGSDPRKHLKAWMRKNGIKPDETAVNVIRREGLLHLDMLAIHSA